MEPSSPPPLPLLGSSFSLRRRLFSLGALSLLELEVLDEGGPATF